MTDRRSAGRGFGAALAVCGALAAEAGAASPPPMAPPAEQIDLIRVDKSERLMVLLKDGEIVRSYRVALGPEPLGHKLQAGDGRTPVGRYEIDWRNPKSDFHLSLHISYPNLGDLVEATRRGVDAGRFIMIHGDASSRDPEGLLDTSGDWTDGCIAVTDAEMNEIWSLTPDGTVIEIRD